MALNFANNNSLSAITSLPASISGGGMTLISTQTASSSSTISFTSGIDDSYDEYVFKFYNIHPATNNTEFQFNMSADSGSNYNVTKTTTTFNAHHNEADSQALLLYDTNADLAQGTGFQLLAGACGNDNDQSISGSLHLFNPSSTTFVKHFIARVGGFHEADYAFDFYTAGYGNTTSTIDAVQFKMSSGTFDGVIKLYGVS